MSKQPLLTFKDDVTSNGNRIKVATINGELVRLSEQDFSYENANGETITYKLGTAKFTDDEGTTFQKSGFVVYQASYEQGMEVGEKYLGSIQLSQGRKPWASLSAFVADGGFSEADFADVVWDDVPESISLK